MNLKYIKISFCTIKNMKLMNKNSFKKEMKQFRKKYKVLKRNIATNFIQN